MQVSKILRAFQLRVFLGHHQQARERGGELVLGLLVFGQARGVGGRGGEIDSADRGSGVGDLGEGAFFEIGRPADGLNQVGDQVGASLIDALHLGPLLIDGL